MLYFSPSKNCTKNVSARTLRLSTEALPRLLLGHITQHIQLTLFAQISPYGETSHIPRTLSEMLCLRKAKRMGEKTLKRKRCLTWLWKKVVANNHSKKRDVQNGRNTPFDYT